MTRNKLTKLSTDSKKTSSDDAHLGKQDYEDEIDNRQFSMFWDSLDLEASWKNVFRLLVIRFAFTMVQVHLKKHPDEIF